MAHFAELDDNNIVQRVIVISNKDTSDNNGVEIESLGIAFCQRLYGGSTKWKQTSYNNSFRKSYAGTGMVYNEQYDAFIMQQPYPSWSLNSDTIEWEAPIPYPESEGNYEWNEDNQSWDLIGE